MNKKTLAGQGIPAIRESAASLALPGTQINPPMDAENKDTTTKELRGKANADAVLASTQQATPQGTTTKRLNKKAKVESKKESPAAQMLRADSACIARMLHAANAACGGITRMPAIVPTEEKAVPVAAKPVTTDETAMLPEKCIVVMTPVVNWPEIPPKLAFKARFETSMIRCNLQDRMFEVVSCDGKGDVVFCFDKMGVTRRRAWASLLEYLRALYGVA